MVDVHGPPGRVAGSTGRHPRCFDWGPSTGPKASWPSQEFRAFRRYQPGSGWARKPAQGKCIDVYETAWGAQLRPGGVGRGRGRARTLPLRGFAQIASSPGLYALYGRVPQPRHRPRSSCPPNAEKVLAAERLPPPRLRAAAPALRGARFSWLVRLLQHLLLGDPPIVPVACSCCSTAGRPRATPSGGTPSSSCSGMALIGFALFPLTPPGSCRRRTTSPTRRTSLRSPASPVAARSRPRRGAHDLGLWQFSNPVRGDAEPARDVGAVGTLADVAGRAPPLGEGTARRLPGPMFVAVLVTGNHFVLDAVIGAVDARGRLRHRARSTRSRRAPFAWRRSRLLETVTLDARSRLAAR